MSRIQNNLQMIRKTKNFKNEKFKRNDHDSFASFLFEINFEVSVIVNFFFFRF